MTSPDGNHRGDGGEGDRNPYTVSHVRWAFSYTWAANRRLLIAISAVSVVRSLLPAVLAVIVRAIVNAVADILGGQNLHSSDLPLWLGCGFVGTTATIVSNAAFSYLSERQRDELDLKISRDVLGHADRLDYAHFEDPAFQDLMHRARQDVAHHFSGFVTTSLAFMTSIGQIFTLAALLTTIEPMVVVLVAPLSIPYLIFHWRFSKRRFEEQQSRAENSRKQAYFFSQMTGYESVAEVKVYGLAPLFKGKLIGILELFRDHNKKFQRLDLLGKIVFAMLSVGAVYVAFWLAIQRVLEGALTIGDVAIFGGAAAQLRYSIEAMIASIGGLRWLTLNISNLRTFLAVKANAGTHGSAVPAVRRGAIEIKNATFTYPGATTPAIRDVSLRIEPGEIVALVGENGAGKTTLAKLLVNLYQPDSGEIFFDDHELRQLSPDYIHAYVALVLQNFGRYEATAAENIAYGDWKRLLENPSLIRRAADQAGVGAMIEKLPDGYETMLGRSFGVHNLSGGQWQLIAIARAFAREAALIVLDEPTASLDARAECALFSRYKMLAQGRTTLLVSHRFSTVSMADRILVMDAGRIVEEGTHKELLARGDLYAHLYVLHTRQMEGNAN